MVDKMDISTRYQFPIKLHGMLNDAEREKNESIVSWLPHGRGFKVHNRHDFETKIMPRYFTEKYDSFRVLLGQWGFLKLSRRGSRDRGGYFHNLFIKGKEELVEEKDKPYMLAAMPNFLPADDEPDLYAIAEKEDGKKEEKTEADSSAEQKKKPPTATTSSAKSSSSKATTTKESSEKTAVSEKRKEEASLKRKEAPGKLSSGDSKEKPKKKKRKLSQPEPDRKSNGAAQKKSSSKQKTERRKEADDKASNKTKKKRSEALEKKTKKKKSIVKNSNASMDGDSDDDSAPSNSKGGRAPKPRSSSTGQMSRLEMLRNIPLCQYYLPPLQFSPSPYAMPPTVRDPPEVREPLHFDHLMPSLHLNYPKPAAPKRKLNLAAAAASMTQRKPSHSTVRTKPKPKPKPAPISQASMAAANSGNHRVPKPKPVPGPTGRPTMASADSGNHRGITMRESGKWQAQFYYSGKSRYIGVFVSREEACIAYESVRRALKADGPYRAGEPLSDAMIDIQDKRYNEARRNAVENAMRRKALG